MDDLGFFVRGRLSNMDNKHLDALMWFIASSILGLVYVISSVVAEQTKTN